jgi:putative ABC transport system permease protein
VVKALARKRLRDLVHLRGQVVAIALVVACGVAVVVTSRASYESLVVSQATYYAEYRFADVFANLKRAPESLRARIAAIPGVAAVETRIVAQVTLDVPGLEEPATGRLVSVPEHRVPILNDLHLRSGRWLEPGRRDEVIASEAFANANRLHVGSTIGAVLHGRWQELTIVGIALSPEYVYEIQGTSLFPDNKRFGVLWISRDAIGPPFQMEGAFNDVSVRLTADASAETVIDRLDKLLERYGGLGAYGREDQVSARFLSDEIQQQRVSGTMIPAIFLAVAAFLLNVVLSRLIAMQRDQIAVLKAFGYTDASVALHYMGFAMAAVAAGAVIGIAAGLWLGSAVNRMYVDFYRFPVLRFEPGFTVIALAVGVSALAAVLGALGAVRRVLALPPAEAMRPEPPARYGAGPLERMGLLRRLPASLRMIWRNVSRRPGRAVLSVLGVAFAVAILLVGRFFLDAIENLSDVQFRAVQREDTTVVFHEPLASETRHAIARLPGALQAEPYRVVPARLRFGSASRRVAVFGLPEGAELRRILGADLHEVEPPREGVVLTERLAEILGVGAGDRLTVEVLEGERPRRRVTVVGTIDELFGLNAYMEARSLHRLMREQGSWSGAYLRIDDAAAPAFHAELKRMPAVAGASSRLAMLRSFDDTLAKSLGIFTGVLIFFASVIACAVVYNSARIALSERGRELASLRVLGFTRGEISAILLGEQAILTVLALPVGFWIGRVLCTQIAGAYQWESFRMPVVLTLRTHVFAAATIALAALASAVIVRRRLDQLDLVAVLKTRE